MLSPNDLRSGLTIRFEGQIYVVLEAEHVKRGRGLAFVRARLKNVETGATVQRTLRGGDKIEQAIVEKRDMQYLYASGNEHVFMDTETYEQLSVSDAVLGDDLRFLKEGETTTVLVHDGRVVNVQLPSMVRLKVVETDPGVRGDTVSGGTKPARLETGAVVQVPLFIQTGDLVEVDPRSGSYLGRA